MNKFFLSLTILAILAVGTYSATICPSVQCTGLSLNPSNGVGELATCANKTNSSNGDVVYVNQCPSSDLWCYGANTLAVSPVGTGYGYGNCMFKHTGGSGVLDLLPGSACTSNNQCNSKNCTGGYCGGNQQDQTCTTNSDCDVGFWCQTLGDLQNPVSTCQSVVYAGGFCDYEQSTLCGYGLTCINAKCVQIMSLPIGAQVQVGMGPGYEFAACSSLTTQVNTQTDPPTATCIAAPKLVGPQLVNTIGTACTYAVNGANQQSTYPSECHFSQSGKAVCPLGVGDVQEQLQTIYSNYFAKNVSAMCHIDFPISSICDKARTQLGVTPQLEAYMNVYGENFDASVGQPYVFGTIYLADNADCVKKQVTYQYWSAFGSASALSMGAAVLFGLIASMF